MSDFVSQLLSQMKDDSATVRQAAVESLAEMRASSALPQIMEVMEKDESPDVRAAAIRAATRLQPATEAAGGAKPGEKKTFFG